MQMNAKVIIDIQREEIQCNVDVTLDTKNSEITFYLNKHLELMEPMYIRKDLNTLEYRAEVNAYTFEFNKEVSDITIKYHGTIDGWMNCIRSDFVSLNLYSAWLPVFKEYDLKPYDKRIEILGLEDFDVVNATKRNDKVVIVDSTMDAIVIAAKGRCFSDLKKNSIRITILDKEHSKVGQYVDDILDYYISELNLPMDKEHSFNVATNPYGTGGFNRKNFLVLQDIPDDEFVVSRFLAHEIGHFWASGADTTSYHDWLNESFAEILAILYIYHKFDDSKVKNYCEQLIDKATSFPNIITKDGSRPEGVHVKGTALFIEFLAKFGVSAMIELINTFILLDKKDTNSFLKSLLPEYRDYLQQKIGK